MIDGMARLTTKFAEPGIVTWIGVRPGRREIMLPLEQAEISFNGLVGDRRTSPGKRAVTLIQAEHLPVIAGFMGMGELDPSILRRNILVRGINLLALRKVAFSIGTARLQGTGPCAPCSRMEEALGSGGFNAVRGHGGITAEVLSPGKIEIGDLLEADHARPEPRGEKHL